MRNFCEHETIDLEKVLIRIIWSFCSRAALHVIAMECTVLNVFSSVSKPAAIYVYTLFDITLELHKGSRVTSAQM
jgi:hypothetical protein